MKNWLFNVLLILTVVILSHKSFYLFFEVYEVDGFSMRPNFEDKETFFVRLNYYKDNKIKYGDVVILKFKNEEGEFLKRVVGLPNDKIKIKNGILSINGKSKTSSKEIEMNISLEKLTSKLFYKVLNVEKNDSDFNFKLIDVPKGHYFVLGDNRQKSGDSREYGTVPIKQILHKVIPKNNFIYKFSFLL